MTAPTERPWICRVKVFDVGGLTLQWFRDPADTSYRDHVMVSASAAGVRVHCWLHEVPAEVLERASVAHRTLELGDERAAVRHATGRPLDVQLESQVESQP